MYNVLLFDECWRQKGCPFLIVAGRLVVQHANVLTHPGNDCTADFHAAKHINKSKTQTLTYNGQFNLY